MSYLNALSDAKADVKALRGFLERCEEIDEAIEDVILAHDQMNFEGVKIAHLIKEISKLKALYIDNTKDGEREADE